MRTTYRPDLGSRPGDAKAIGSIVDYLAVNDLSDVVLMDHSYGGMVITGVADAAPERTGG